MDNSKNSKVKSIISFPNTYVVIDVETTGRSPSYDEIIEFAAVKICTDKITDSFSSLVRPTRTVSSFITGLTGITNEMLTTAPDISSVLPKFINFLGDNILVGHNINYDINFINASTKKYNLQPLTNDFVDTLRIFRKLHPELDHHRLMDLSNIYNIDYSDAHRSLADCEITYKCFCALAKEVIEKYKTTEEFIKCFKATNLSHKLRASDILSNTDVIDSDNPLSGKTFVFTGTLGRMSRREAMQIVVNHGGINGDNVTKQTNYLVLGSIDYCASLNGKKSTKHKKAESLALAGQDIEIISEDVFYDMISE